MNSTRLARFTVNLVVACLIVTIPALAGTTTATEVSYAAK